MLKADCGPHMTPTPRTRRSGGKSTLAEVANHQWFFRFPGETAMPDGFELNRGKSRFCWGSSTLYRRSAVT
jgi:hypothetical protein